MPNKERLPGVPPGPSIIPILDQTDRMEVLARAHELWFDLPKTAAIAERFHQCNAQDFASAFEMKYSLSLERFYLIAVSLWSGFQNHASNTAVASTVVGHARTGLRIRSRRRRRFSTAT